MFLKRKLFIAFISVPAPIFSKNPSPILTPNRVLILKMQYEIVKKAVFKQKANNKQMRIVYICCRHKPLDKFWQTKNETSFLMLQQLGLIQCQGMDWGQSICSQASFHRADSEISLSLPAWPFETEWFPEASELSLGDRHVHVVPFA